MTPPLDTAAPLAPARPENFRYSPMFPLGPDETPYRRLDVGGVSTCEAGGRRILRIAPQTLEALAFAAVRDASHLLRPGHLAQLRAILDDPEASANDRFVALDLLKNANIAAGMVLPMCQDTGTAIVFGKKGQRVWVEGDEEEALSYGVFRAYTETNLRYSQMAPLSMFEEVNTGSNLPVQFDIFAAPGEAHAEEFEFLFILKGGGSANKTFLYQQTRAVLNRAKLLAFLEEKIKTLGTSACPPYHLAIVIGGTSAEATLKTVKLASTRYLDSLPTRGSLAGHAIRDPELEAEVHKLTQNLGIGAQFGGKYFCHDVRVIRLPRHGASLPIGIGVSCSADRQIKAKITAEGVFRRAAGDRPGEVSARAHRRHPGRRGGEDRPQPPDGRDPARTVEIPGEDAAVPHRHHGGGARHRARQDQGTAGPRRGPAAITSRTIQCITPARPRRPAGYATGSFGPTTAGRMDSYVEEFMRAGGPM